MINVKVMYSNLKIQTELLSEVDKLPKDNVLFILVEDTEREGKNKNISMIHTFDSYALCQKTVSGQPWIMLVGWDDDDFIWRRADKCEGCENRQIVDMPIGVMHVIFRGVSVTNKVWEKALAKFDKEMVK